MSGKVRSAAALTLLACMEAANACSMVMVNPLISGANAVSVRTMDYSGTAAGLDLVTSVNVVPKGSKLWTGLMDSDLDLAPVVPPSLVASPATEPKLDQPTLDDPRLYFTSKHSFVGAVQCSWGSVKPMLDQVMVGGVVPVTALFADGFGENLFTIVSDGLNDKGLACSVNYDRTVQAYPTAKVTDEARPNIHNIYTICKYILGTFETAEEVVAAMDPKTTQVVTPKLAPMLGAFFPFHIVVSDRYHQVWAMEMQNYENGDGFAWKNATNWGTVTNEPQMEDQLANLDEYISTHENVKYILGVVNETEATRQLPHPNNLAFHYLEAPGSFSSKDRFVRFALFNKIAPLGPMTPATRSFMPPADKVPYASNRAFLTALHFAKLFTRPIALSTYDAQNDLGVTTWRCIRDHANPTFYFQAFADTTWGHVTLANAVQGKGPINEYPAADWKEKKAADLKKKKGATSINTYSVPLNMGELGFISHAVDRLL